MSDENPCGKCGAVCCRYLEFLVPDTRENRLFYRARGCRFKPEPEAILRVYVESRCQYLNGDKCGIYDHRPLWCRTWKPDGEGCNDIRKIVGD